MTNSYVEGVSQVTGACGQTVRNHLQDKRADTLLQINHDLIATLQEMRVLGGITGYQRRIDRLVFTTKGESGESAKMLQCHNQERFNYSTSYDQQY